jgi:hypothetical protein
MSELSAWIKFADRLPSHHDAVGGMVWALEEGGTEKQAMWNWVPPSTPQARETWAANGFVAWRRIRITGAPNA